MVGTAISAVLKFINALPFILTFIIYTSFFLALFSILVSHIYAIYLNFGVWKEKENSSLTYSYICGTGLLRCLRIYKKARELVTDKTWLILSAAGAAYHLGNYKSESKLKLVLLSLIHISLIIIGFPEMIFRYVVGYVYLAVAIAIHWVSLIFLYLLAYIFIPIWTIIDRSMRREQHCPHCYRSFRVPGYVCPSCGTIHKDLIPGKTGILVARCECGQFLPSALATGRSKLDGICPECDKPLAASGAKEFTLQLIGGNTSGKTAFLSAFQHIYREINKNDEKVKLVMFPQEQFDDLDEMFLNGVTQESSKTSTVTYSIVHEYPDGVKDSLVVYDIPDEVLISGIYEQNPLNFAYSNGILIIIDPTSIRKVREESQKKGQMIPVESFAQDEMETEDIIIEFIQQFSRLSNRTSNKMIRIPVAVIINKSDIKTVKNKIGPDAIAYHFRENPDMYENNYAIARNTICRNYVIALGMSNAINNLESVFSNVEYFAVSAMGHMEKQGIPFSPMDVVEPVSWIAGHYNSRLSALLQTSNNTFGNENFRDEVVNGSLEERYKYAEKLLAAKDFDKAENEFKLLGGYKDSVQRAESVVEARYQYARMLFDQNKYEDAERAFAEIDSYRDSKDYQTESTFRMAEIAFNKGYYEEAIKLFSKIGNHRGSNQKCYEARYLLAEQKVLNGDYEGAIHDYNILGEYKDAKQKAKLLAPELVKKGIIKHLYFGKYSWRVLTIYNDKALIISDSIVARASYNTKLMNVVWKDCSLREYLNSTFMDEFTDQERMRIVSSAVKNENNSEYGTSAGEDTIEFVFLLSSREMREYFSSDKDRIPESADTGAKWYWLRSPGGNNTFAAIVDANGSVNEGGNTVNKMDGGIRPAMWIKL